MRIHLPAYLIQDRNYPDLAVGNTVAFALRFVEFVRPLKVEANSAGTSRLTPVPDQDGAGYDAAGTVIHVADGWWAVDVGIRACGDEPPVSARVGASIRGKLSFDVDIAYAETHAAEPDAPALIYDWLVLKIERQMAPLIELQNGLVGRDPSHSIWKPVERTHALRDDYGLAEYLLHAEPVGPPRKSR